MIKTINLDNGLRIIYENIPYYHSCTMGIWLGVGSKNETREENGLSHFIEHLVFKGTQSRSAKDIAEEMDNIGAQLNAFTAKDCTCFYVRVLDSNISEGLDILSDLVYHPSFNKSDIDKEKGVVIEEIAMCLDTPEELLSDLASEALYEGSLSRPILGTQELISAYSRDDIYTYWKKHYFPKNMVLSIVGNFEEENLIELIHKYFDNCPNENSKICTEDSVLKFNHKAIDKPFEQTHIMLSLPSVNTFSNKLNAISIANNIFGGGMSSRLFQSIREDLGLAYTVYSFLSKYNDVGTLNIYAGTNPKTAQRLIEEILRQLELFYKNGFSDKEFKSSKAQYTASIEFSLESSSARMHRLGKSLLIKNEVVSCDKIINDIKNVEKTEIDSLIKEYFTKTPVLSAVGPNASEMINKYKEVLL